MHRVMKVVAAVAGILMLPSIAFAQATIAGVARDASGGVLPGVTVEATSPALIEKVRTTVSDGSGQYRLTDLPPGSYVLTFSLQGFTTSKRSCVAVSGSGVIALNIDLSVGAQIETVIVSGETPCRRHPIGATRGRARLRDAQHSPGHAWLRLCARDCAVAEHRWRGRSGCIDGADDSQHDVLHSTWWRQRRRTGHDQRPHRRGTVRGRRRI